MLNPDYLDGYIAYCEGEPNDALMPYMWQAGWRAAADEDARCQLNSETARWVQ